MTGTRSTHSRAKRDRIIAKWIAAGCFIAIGFGIGVIATLKVVGLTW